MQIGDLFLGVQADLKDFTKDVKKGAEKAGDEGGQGFGAKFKKGLKGFGADFKKDFQKGLGMGAGFGAFNLAKDAIGGVVDALKGAVEQAKEEEAGIARLDGALRNNVPNWDGNRDAIEQNIAKLQKLSAFSDGELRDSMAKLVTRTGNVEEATELMGLAADIARAKNIPLAAASEAVGKAAQGQLGPLKKLGVEIKKGATSQEALADAQLKFSGQAEAYGKTAAGSMESFNNAMGDIMEDVGSALIPVITTLANFARDTLLPALSTVFGVLGDIAKVAGDVLGPVLEGLGPIFQAIGDVIGIVAGAAKGFLDIVGGIIGAVGGVIGGIGDALNPAGAAARDMEAQLRDAALKVGITFEEMRAKVAAEMEATGTDFETAVMRITTVTPEIGAAAMAAVREAAPLLKTPSEIALAWSGEMGKIPDFVAMGTSGITRKTPAWAAAADALAAKLPYAIWRARDEVIRLITQTPADLAAALREKRGAWQDAVALLASDLENPMTAAAELAAIKGELTGKNLAKGLKSKDPVIRAQAQTTKGILEDAWRAATLAALGWGKDAGSALARGLSSRAGEVRTAAGRLAGAAAAALRIRSPAKEGPWSEGGGPEGWGRAFGTSLKDGIRATIPGIRAVAGDLAGSFAMPALTAPTLATPSLGLGALATAGGGTLRLHHTVDFNGTAPAGIHSADVADILNGYRRDESRVRDLHTRLPIRKGA